MKFKHEDWFSHNINIFNEFLSKMKGKKINMLEVGVFEGRGTTWFLKNILTHPESRIYCVDTWTYAAPRYSDVFDNFKYNISNSNYKSKTLVKKGMSGDEISKIKEKMDVIYIDASRHSRNVLEDAVLSYRLLKSNGVMVFDDYTNNKEHDSNCPKPAIDAFLNIYANELMVKKMGWTVVVQKRKKPIKTRPCYSELFKEPSEVPDIFKK